MLRTEARKLASLPKRIADFIEPMDCTPVPKLIDGPEWVYEILCGVPHILCVSERYVALAVIGKLAPGNLGENAT